MAEDVKRERFYGYFYRNMSEKRVKMGKNAPEKKKNLKNICLF